MGCYLVIRAGVAAQGMGASLSAAGVAVDVRGLPGLTCVHDEAGGDKRADGGSARGVWPFGLLRPSAGEGAAAGYWREPAATHLG